MTRTYTLNPVDNARILEAGGPLGDADPEKLTDKIFTVVEVDGRIVAYWMIWKALHLEPLWIHPDHRGNAGIGRALIQQTLGVAAALGEAAAFAVMDPQGMGAGQIERLGFQPAPDRLYYLVLPPAQPAGVM